MGCASDHTCSSQEQYGEEVQYVVVEAGRFGGCSSREGVDAGMCQEFPSCCCYAGKISTFFCEFYLLHMFNLMLCYTVLFILVVASRLRLHVSTVESFPAFFVCQRMLFLLQHDCMKIRKKEIFAVC